MSQSPLLPCRTCAVTATHVLLPHLPSLCASGILADLCPEDIVVIGATSNSNPTFKQLELELPKVYKHRGHPGSGEQGARFGRFRAGCQLACLPPRLPASPLHGE